MIKPFNTIRGISYQLGYQLQLLRGDLRDPNYYVAPRQMADAMGRGYAMRIRRVRNREDSVFVTFKRCFGQSPAAD